MSEDETHRGAALQPQRLPLGLWLSVIANVLAVCAGSVFLLAPAGARFRGSEPEAGAFSGLLILAVLVGLCGGIPVSVRDLFWRRRWGWGAVGLLLALTPFFVAVLMSNLVGALKGLEFD
jgi:hypothetical protein